MFLLLATLCYTFGPVKNHQNKQLLLLWLTQVVCSFSSPAWETQGVEKWKAETGKRRTVQICKGVFLLPNRCFFMHLLLDYFWEIEISWMGLYDTWIILQMDDVRKNHISYIRKKNIMGRASSQNISSKETLCFIGPSTGLESGVKYAEVPSTSSLRCCLTATITSRRGWWGP